MKNIKICVTGGTGFIGSNLVSFLKDKGYWVRAVDNEVESRRKFRGELFDKADEVLNLDLRDLEHAIEAIEGCNYVFHLASDMGGVGYFTANDYYPYMNNMQMDMNMLKASELKAVKRFFYSSSACIYPVHMQRVEGDAPKLAEDMIYPANSDLSYGWEKLMMLRLCERAPIDARVGIFHTIYGPYQEMEGERMKFPTAVATKAIAAQKTGEIEVWGNGRQIRSFLYIDDALEKIYRVMFANEYKGPVNIASDEAVSVDQVVRYCCDFLEIQPEIIHTFMKPSGVLARNADNTKFEALYQYKNKYSASVGFAKLIDFIMSKCA